MGEWVALLFAVAMVHGDIQAISTYRDISGLDNLSEGHVVHEDRGPEVVNLFDDSTTLLVDRKHKLVALVR